MERLHQQSGARAGGLPIRHATDDAEVLELDKLTMSEWLQQRGWTSKRLHRLVDYSCRDDYGLRLDETSAWAGVFYYASRIARPGDAPAEYLTWPEGNGRLVRHLQEVVGARLQRLRAAVLQDPHGCLAANSVGRCDCI